MLLLFFIHPSKDLYSLSCWYGRNDNIGFELCTARGGGSLSYKVAVGVGTSDGMKFLNVIAKRLDGGITRTQ